ncbi:hypothetical protein [Acinetobacter brisouii]|uniref:hypothetical protein n=1 Tax=Acinetobacter brisouii TaxID=396323 RepID=UPI00124BCFA2|nr:hypothetical protein [Acinetobacter brisouii]
MLGLVGAHRTGKTTLAEVFSQKTGALLVKMDISSIQRELGYDSANQSYDFDTRMTIQEALLQRFNAIYATHKGKDAVCDRTPLDLIGYTLGVVDDTLTPEQSNRVQRYISQCIDSANCNFASIVLVQPGIKIVESEKSAKSIAAYIEKLNMIYLGVLCDERLKIQRNYLPKWMTDLDRRVKACELSLGRALTRKASAPQKETTSKMDGIEFLTATRQ